MENNTTFGLPENVFFCKKCNLSNQKPTSINEFTHGPLTKQVGIIFDKNQICEACRSVSLKFNDKIDWDLREKELIELCKKLKKFKGPYNCLVPGSGGKDSSYQASILKNKYGLRPLTVTWAPHIYTDIGWKNFQNWIHVGGYDNYLFHPNGKIHRLVTRNATINLLHPFQPFIIGQKFFSLKMASLFNIPIIFYGEQPSDYGTVLEDKKSFSKNSKSFNSGFTNNPLGNLKVKELKIGGKSIEEYIDEGYSEHDFNAYIPPSLEEIKKKKIETHFLGYYLKWIPQENFYYSVKNSGFQVNHERIEGTYQKYASLDDKTDGFFYYTYYIKFGIGRAMLDSSMEVRNNYITKDEGAKLIEQFDGEYPQKYEKEFLEYVNLSREEFNNLCDKFRPKHLWEKRSNRWRLKYSPLK